MNLAAGLAKVGQRVLLVDLDPQGNATIGSGIDKRALELTVYDVLLESASIQEAAVLAEKCGYHVLGADRELSDAEIELVALERRNERLKAGLAGRRCRLDFVLIDCPPSLSMLTLNGLCAAHGVMRAHAVRILCAGRSDRPGQRHQAGARQYERRAQDHWPAACDVRSRTTLQQQVSDQLKSHFGDKVFDSVIPRNVRLAEAPSYGLPGVVFDASAKGSKAFVDFAKEMVQRIKTM